MPELVALLYIGYCCLWALLKICRWLENWWLLANRPKPVVTRIVSSGNVMHLTPNQKK